MHGIAVLEDNIEASPFCGRGNHPARICSQREFGIFVSHFAVLIKGEPGVSKGSPICEDNLGWSCREVLAIEDAAICIVESGRVYARASFAFMGQGNLGSASHPLRRKTGSNLSVGQAVLPARHVYANLVAAGLILLVASKRFENKAAVRVGDRSFNESGRKSLVTNGVLAGLVILIRGFPKLYGSTADLPKTISSLNHRTGTGPLARNRRIRVAPAEVRLCRCDRWDRAPQNEHGNFVHRQPPST